MGGMRLGRTRSMVRTKAAGRQVVRTRATKSIGLLAVLLLTGLVLGASGASAEPLCTDTWTGPNEGAWQEGTNWSTGSVPSSSDVACIEAGKTVKSQR